MKSKNVKSFNLTAAVAVLSLTSLLSVTSATAATNMSVFEGYKSSDAVLAGDYAQAIELANIGIESKNSYKRTVEATSLCVAYTKTAMLEEAKNYCEMAVTASVKPSTLRRAAEKYSTDKGTPISIIEVAETNHKAVLTLAAKKELTASVL